MLFRIVSSKGRPLHSFRKELSPALVVLLLSKKMNHQDLLLSDSPADWPLLVMFFGTIIFLLWLDYGKDKHK
jgi:hypothetical protein